MGSPEAGPEIGWSLRVDRSLRSIGRSLRSDFSTTVRKRFVEGVAYKKGPLSSSSSCSSCSRTPTPLDPPNLQDLFIQPSKVIDLWRIEGGGLDLHIHQERSSFPPHSLEGPQALVFLWKP